MDIAKLRLQEKIASKILLIRGKRAILDRDLAELYGVTTANLNKAIRKNIKRFPTDSILSLTCHEVRDLSQSDKSSDIIVFALTEQGIGMLSSVLNSERAVQLGIEINWILSREFDKYPDLVEFAQEYTKHKKHLLLINDNGFETTMISASLGQFISNKYNEINPEEGSSGSISKFGYSEMTEKLINAESENEVEQMVSIWFRHGLHGWIDFEKSANEKIVTEFTDHLSMDDYMGKKNNLLLENLSRFHYGLLESFVPKLLLNEKTFIVASMKPGESLSSLPPSFLNCFKVFDLVTGEIVDEAKPSNKTKDNPRFLFNDKGFTVTIDDKQYEFGNKEREYNFLKKLYDNLNEYVVDDDLANEIGLNFENDEISTILTKTKLSLIKILNTHNILIKRKRQKAGKHGDGAYKLVML
jgi:hypothetical protein